MKSAIRRLDMMPLGAIEATIAEVTLNDQLQYGDQYFFQRGNNTILRLSNTAGAVSSAISPGLSYVLSATSIRLFSTCSPASAACGWSPRRR